MTQDLLRLRAVATLRNGISSKAMLIALVAVGASGGVRATAQEAPELSGATVLAPIVVTGEKAEREYTDTYTSVGVATGEDLIDYNVSGLNDVFDRMANVRWNSANGGNNGFTIRGVNSEGMVSPENNTPVASVIIDGATQSVESARRGSRGVWDVKQVEVLRGPQSLLQGRAALAGAVVVETNDPTFTPEFGLRGTIGDEERRDGAFFASGPLSDQLALRISGEFHEETTDIKYADESFEELGEDEYRNLRAKLLWAPTAIDGLEVKLTVSDTYDKPADRTVSGDFYDGEFDGDAIDTELREATNRNYILDVGYEINSYLKFESVSAWVDAKTDISSVEDQEDVYFRDDVRNSNDFTQDLRLVFGETDDTVSGVVGLFYGDFTSDTDSQINYPGADLSFIFPGLTLGDLVEDGLVQDIETKNSTEQLSAYADIRYRVTDRATILAGGRYLRETVKSEISGTVLNTTTLALEEQDYKGSETFNEFLPSIGVAFDLSAFQSVAVTAKKGYRSGYVEEVEGEINEVDPEYVWTYELAYRQEAADGRWLFGANVFYNDYQDQQIPVSADGVYTDVYTVNAGDSHSYGAEIEGRIRLDNGLSLYGALGYVETEFDELNTSDGDFSGNDFPEAPQTTASLGAFYQHVSGLFVSGDASYTSSYYSSGSISNDNELKVDSYWLANASLGYNWGNYTVRAFVDNLLDEDYVTSLSNSGTFGSDATTATLGRGRTFGLTFDAVF